MDIKHAQLSSDRYANTARDTVPGRQTGHVRFEEISQLPEPKKADNSRDPAVEKQNSKRTHPDNHDKASEEPADSSRYLVVRSSDKTEPREVDHWQKVQIMRDRINDTYVKNGKEAETDAVLHDIQKYQSHIKNTDNRQVGSRAIDLLA